MRCSQFLVLAALGCASLSAEELATSLAAREDAALDAALADALQRAGAEIVAALGPDQALAPETVRALGARTVRCLLYTSPSPRDQRGARMPSSA